MNTTTLRHVLFVLICPFLLGACGEGFQSILSTSAGLNLGSCNITNNQSLNINSFLSPTVSNQNTSSKSTQEVTAKLSSKVQAGDEVVVLIDNQCMDADNGGLLAQSITNSKLRKTRGLQAYTHRLDGDLDMASLEADLDDESCIMHVEKQVTLRANAVPNDNLFNQQQFHADVQTALAWDIFYNANTGIGANNNVVIAVVDTGVDYNHPDLANKMWQNAAGEFGFDFFNNDNDPLDDNFHGTHVAGLAASEQNNTIGGAGIMGRGAQIMAVKVLGADGSGNLDDVVNGIAYAAENNADIINLSLGAPGAIAALQTVMQEAVAAGSFIVVAASNEGQELDANNFVSPASYTKDIQGAVSVGATVSGTRALANFSNFSNEYVEIATPGSVGMLAPFPNNAYQAIEGTSMASPVVAGAAGMALALFETRNIQLTPAQLEAVLLGGAVTANTLANRIKDNNFMDVLALAQFANAASDLRILTQPLTHESLVSRAATLSVAVTTDFMVTYQWQKDGVDIVGATGSSFVIDNAQASDSGTYRVNVSQLGRVIASQDAQLNIVSNCN